MAYKRKRKTITATGDISRSAPKVGYDTPAKQSYREAVWSEFRKAVPDLGAAGNVVMMPSREGLEIETAIASGVPEGSIIAFDRDKALIRAAPWRISRPSVRARWGIVSHVGNQLAYQEGPIRVANLDLCSTVNASVVKQIRQFVEAVRWPEKGRLTLGITIARSREDSLVAMLLNANRFEPVCSDPRLSALLNLCGFVDSDRWRLTVHAEGKYISHAQPMGWVVLTLERWLNYAHRIGESLRGDLVYLNKLCQPSHYHLNASRALEVASGIAAQLVEEGFNYLRLPEHVPHDVKGQWSIYFMCIRASALNIVKECMDDRRSLAA